MKNEFEFKLIFNAVVAKSLVTSAVGKDLGELLFHDNLLFIHQAF